VAEIAGANLIHERMSLPPHIEQKCQSIVQHFGLKYSSMDIVKDRQGRFIFLELNPNGQWGWIEQLVGYPVRDQIIDTLWKFD
jgi:glutathione synthase/RimK-type ligase-like ATP-grasp enzyme